MENFRKFVARILKPRILYLQFFLNKFFTKSEFINFRCTVCGKNTSAPLRLVKNRESASCGHCGSNRRFRSIIASLSEELFGEIKTLPEFPQDKSIKGIGLSDSYVYGGRLEKKLGYTNTYYHKAPLLDIMDIDASQHDSVDFIITSEVFEHVPPPVEKAFDNLYKLLKQNGVCVFSVPYYNSGKTREHFPELYQYEIVKKDGGYMLLNHTKEGKTQEFTNLRFHGGPGATLEMRFFAKSSLLDCIQNAGFTNIRLHDKSYPEFGILLEPDEHSLIVTMRKE